MAYKCYKHQNLYLKNNIYYIIILKCYCFSEIFVIVQGQILSLQSIHIICMYKLLHNYLHFCLHCATACTKFHLKKFTVQSFFFFLFDRFLCLFCCQQMKFQQGLENIRGEHSHLTARLFLLKSLLLSYCMARKKVNTLLLVLFCYEQIRRGLCDQQGYPLVDH